MSGDDAGRQAGRLLDGSTWLGSARLDMVGFYGGDASFECVTAVGIASSWSVVKVIHE